MNWQLQEAKARLSEVVKKAEAEGPQHITVRGEPTVVVLSEVDYQQLIGPEESLVEFMRRSPLYSQEDVEFARDKSPARDVAL